MAILTLGAQYLFERTVSNRLYKLWGIIHRAYKETRAKLPQDLLCEDEQLQNLQGLLLIVVYGTWSVVEDLHQEALALQSQLANSVRKLGLKDSEPHRQLDSRTQQENWEAWIVDEGIRRTKFTVCLVLSIVQLKTDAVLGVLLS